MGKLCTNLNEICCVLNLINEISKKNLGEGDSTFVSLVWGIPPQMEGAV
jgi:hypothetical protein